MALRLKIVCVRPGCSVGNAGLGDVIKRRGSLVRRKLFLRGDRPLGKFTPHGGKFTDLPRTDETKNIDDFCSELLPI